jgi:hypothetical protein
MTKLGYKYYDCESCDHAIIDDEKFNETFLGCKKRHDFSFTRLGVSDWVYENRECVDYSFGNE